MSTQRERRIAFLARDLVWADRSGGVLAFSYAARKLEASLRSAPDLSDVETTVIDLRTDDPDAFFEEIRRFRPSVVAASTYIWSAKLFGQVAEKVRHWDPSVRFVMGGPAARPSLLSLAPYAPYARYIDAVVTGEGEEVIRRVASEHTESDWTLRVPGLKIWGPLGWRNGSDIERPVLDAYASPYQLAGVPRGGIGYLETFRGCPISCAFCQWGAERSDRVHSAEYLAKHLRGLAQAGCESVYVLDAAFNLSSRAFRNLLAAETEVGVLRKLQVLGHIYPTYIKDEHLDFFDSFRRAEITVGLQSIDSQVLKRLGRPFDLERFERVLGEMRGRFDIDLEIILGLPGDNPLSFRQTFERAIEIATTVRVFYCLALPDALLERTEEFGIDFDPETFEVRSAVGWSAESLRAEWDYVRSVAQSMYRPSFGPNWTDFRTAFPSVHDARPPVPAFSREVVDRLRHAIDHTGLGWRLSDASSDGDHLLLALEGSSGHLLLEVARARPERQGFSVHEGMAYSYRGALGEVAPSELERLIARLHRSVHAVARPLLGEELGPAPA